MKSRKSASTAKSYPPGLALSRIRFYLDVLEGHLGIGDERRAKLREMEVEADQRTEAERFSRMPTAFDIAEDAMNQKKQEDQAFFDRV